jgi:hypothetical protein
MIRNMPSPKGRALTLAMATNHGCYSLNLFSSYTKVRPIPVKLPNGSIVKIGIVGDIHIIDSLILTNAFYLPHFTYNLLSVSKVTNQLSCTFTFANSVYAIYDSQQRMIGSGKLLNDLYYLEGTHSSLHKLSKFSSGIVCATLFIPQSALWHFRFGHASSARLEIMNKLYPSICVNKDCFCDVCHLAKQKKLSYQLSTNRSTRSLEFVTCGYLGP